MSRIGKKIINIPKDVKVETFSKNITIIGKYGMIELDKHCFVNVNIFRTPEKIYLTCCLDTKKAKARHGLVRALLQNMIYGVDNLFSKILVLEGIGYKFQLDKNIISVNVGFTHIIKFVIPKNLSVKLESPIKLVICGVNKEQVGLLAARIKNIRIPEPYKGKGILYLGEKIRRKTGKTGK